jgi:hypothetical protein
MRNGKKKDNKEEQKYYKKILHAWGKVLFLTEHHTMKVYWGSGGVAPLTDLSNRWR